MVAEILHVLVHRVQAKSTVLDSREGFGGQNLTAVHQLSAKVGLDEYAALAVSELDSFYGRALQVERSYVNLRATHHYAA